MADGYKNTGGDFFDAVATVEKLVKSGKARGISGRSGASNVSPDLSSFSDKELKQIHQGSASKLGYSTIAEKYGKSAVNKIIKAALAEERKRAESKDKKADNKKLKKPNMSTGGMAKKIYANCGASVPGSHKK
tara:strand:- start:632 stop:1030 length:399 start_codon:yes stop_codon:yes gene_type:complete